MILMHEDKMIAGLVPEEGGGGGHVIQNASGIAVAQEPTMQFTDSHVSDDSQNDKTVIENIKPLTGAEFDVVTEDGFYAITDEDDATMEDTSADYVDVVADGVKTVETLLNELYAKVDGTKLGATSYIQWEHRIFRYSRNFNNGYAFFMTYGDTANEVVDHFVIAASQSLYTEWRNGTITSYVSQVLSNGTVLRLYYGTDSCVTDLINQAKYTYMESGESVESALTYSTSEHVVGKWIDGKPLYEKIIDCGVLPSSTGKTVSHGITGISAVVKFEMVAYGNGQAISIPYFDGTNRCIAYMTTGNTGQINIFTDTNAFSSYTKSYAIIRYTKSS